MITRNQKDDIERCRGQVLEQYRAFEKFCCESDMEVESHIKLTADKIKNGVFNLIVLGEANSGKSTFINAYLRTRIMPVDAKECTSAIVRIRHGNEHKLTATLASGETINRTGENEVKEFLAQHAAIDDKFKQLPIAAINDLLVVHNGNVPDDDWQDFIGMAVVGNNRYKLKPDIFKARAEEYRDDKAKKWGDIVTEINVSWPLPDMQDVTIVDTPGVGASGDLNKKTLRCLKEADAILFTSMLENADSNAVHEFFDVHKNENSFLVCTGRSKPDNESDLNTKIQNVYDMFETRLDRSKIIVVDSKAELTLVECSVILKKFRAKKRIDEYFNNLKGTPDYFREGRELWRDAEGDFEIFKRDINALSNFDEIRTVLKKLGTSAKREQFTRFLDRLVAGYEQQLPVLYKELDLSKGKLNTKSFKDIQREIARIQGEIKKVQREIKIVENHMADTLPDIRSDFINKGGIVEQGVKEISARCNKRLGDFGRLGGRDINPETFKRLREVMFGMTDDLESFRGKMIEQLLERCNSELSHCIDDSFTFPPEVYKPVFSKSELDENFKKMEEKAKEQSGYNDILSSLKSVFAYIPVKVGFKMEWALGYREERLSEELQFVHKQLKNSEAAILKDVTARVDKCHTEYNRKLRARLDLLQNKFDNLETEKVNAEDVEKLEKRIWKVHQDLDGCNELRKELKF